MNPRSTNAPAPDPLDPRNTPPEDSYRPWQDTEQEQMEMDSLPRIFVVSLVIAAWFYLTAVFVFSY
jgi:hypothetical protein